MMDKLSQRHRLILDMFRRADRAMPPLQLAPRLIAMERVFRAPPLTQSLVGAIHLISPHLMHIGLNESDRDFWEAEQNGACWAEFEHLGDAFASLKPRRILEIGPGMGRSLVFFSRMLGWQDCDVHAFEGTGTEAKYTMNGPRAEDSFCGNIPELRRVLEHNGIRNVTIHDAASTTLIGLPGPFDLVYGFYTIGFHWSLKHFMPELRTLMAANGSAVFTVPRNFRPFAELDPLPWRVIAKDNVGARDGECLLLIGPIAESMSDRAR
jgi:hypothetical protein